MNVLVVAAHPDDEVLMCGGTIARLAKEGHEVSIGIMGIRHLEEASRQAAECLGVKRRMVDHLIDQRFDAQDFLDLVAIVDLYLLQCQPAAVYTHHTMDLNLDHALAARAVLTATRPKPGCSVKDVYMGEVPSSTEWGFNYQFKPNVFVDVMDFFRVKLDAMNLYKSEVKHWPHPRSEQALEVRMMQWGSVAGLDHAEAFELVRSVR